MIFALGDTTHFFVQKIFPSKINWEVTVQMLHGDKWIILHIIIADFKNHTSYLIPFFIYGERANPWKGKRSMVWYPVLHIYAHVEPLWMSGLGFVALTFSLCFRLHITKLFSLGKVTMVGWSEMVDTELFSIGLIYPIPIHSSPSSWETEFPM